MNVLHPNQIYALLQPLGLRKRQVRAILPSWWDDAVASSQTGAWEFVLLLARRLSLDAEALARGEVLPKGALQALQYKHRASVDTDALQIATHVASSLAQSVIAAMNKPYRALPTTESIHERIKAIGVGRVDFEGLLTFCWESGIPVIPLQKLPVGVRKMDGAALRFEGGPAIVVARKADSKSWLSFILAHELGHIAKGHLKPGSSIVDVSLSKEAAYAVESSKDKAEQEADEFALAILGGQHADSWQKKWGQRESPLELASLAREAGLALGCAAGHLLLRYAFRTKRWQEVTMALRFLDEDFDAQQSLVNRLAEYIDLEGMPTDTREYVEAILGITREQ